MSAVVHRERRKTAGQRMSSLVGKAQEEDDAFWGHETWAEDDSGNDSFRESDEDSEQRKDTFDSDFDDSESDNEDEEAAAGEEEEQELQREERGNRQKKSNYVDIAKGGRALLQKAKGVKGMKGKRAVGNGINAGIVLNLPPPALVSSSVAPVPPEGSTIPTDQPLAPAPVSSSTATATATAPTQPTSSPTSNKRSRMAAELGVRTTLTSVRERRSQTRKRDSRNSTPTYSDTASGQPSNKKLKPQTGTITNKKSKRRQYAQEELLLEAVKDTEPENQRWLLARKRVQDSENQDKDSLAALRDKNRGKNVIQKYHSRRGCLITLTFPEMDAVPEILTRKSETPTKPKPTICVITGKPARYMDPKTGQGYYDAAAFKELRRRHDAGEPLDQQPKAKPKPKPKPKQTAPKDAVPGSSNSTTPSGTQQPKSPSSAGFVLDLGGAQKSPGSTRSSGRKWKPSEKMIQGLGRKQEGDSSNVGNASSPSEQEADTVLASAPALPSIASGVKTETDKTAATANDSSSKTNNAGKKNGSAQNAKKKAPSSKAKTNHSAPKAGTKPTSETATGSTASKSDGKSKSPDAKAPTSEHVYVIPSDTESGLTEPRYVTQSELIMQAITNYSRAQEGQQTAKTVPNGNLATSNNNNNNNNESATNG